MHSWETISPGSYDDHWCENGSFKQEQIQNLASSSNTNTDSIASSDNMQPIIAKREIMSGQNYFFDQPYNSITNTQRPPGFNPLTPPGCPNAVVPQTNLFPDNITNEQNTVHLIGNNFKNGNKVASSSLTPSHTPPIDITPPKSPKYFSETPEKDSEMLSQFNDSCEDTRSLDSDNDNESIRIPKYNSHGKVKQFKCKQCDFVAFTKLTFWEHTKIHIRPEKVLKCPKCPFVTEYKHHLEYHLRNHDGKKPFQCNKCSYHCVNKSMLNSHLKSHSNIYQYRCADCSYVTKYCHSLKLHLRKYTHKPAMVLNEDGTPNPLPIIDIYGTRRGPKMKSVKKMVPSSDKEEIQPRIPNKIISEVNFEKSMAPQQHANILANILPNPLSLGSLQFFPYLNLNLHMLAAQQRATLNHLSSETASSVLEYTHRINMDEDETSCTSDQDTSSANDINERLQGSAMNLSQLTPSKAKYDRQAESFQKHSAKDITDTPSSNFPPSRRRKGRAFKLDSVISLTDDEETLKIKLCEEKQTADIDNKALKQNFSRFKETGHIADEQENQKLMEDVDDDATSEIRANRKQMDECKYCGISFKDTVLYTIHMGYHGYDDVFKCNMCGEKCDDRVSFFLHIARNSHS